MKFTPEEEYYGQVSYEALPPLRYAHVPWSQIAHSLQESFIVRAKAVRAAVYNPPEKRLEKHFIRVVSEQRGDVFRILAEEAIRLGAKL